MKSTRLPAALWPAGLAAASTFWARTRQTSEGRQSLRGARFGAIGWMGLCMMLLTVAITAVSRVTLRGQSSSGTIIFVGPISTVAGNGTPGFSGDGGPATLAQLGGSYLSGNVKDSAGNLYICDSGNARIRKVDTSGIITTFAGDGTAGYSGDGGPATSATINGASGIVVDAAGNVYFSEFNNYDIRKVNTSGTISTYASLPSKPTGIAIDGSGNIYVALYSQDEILKVATDGTKTVVAGTAGFAGYSGDGGPATSARLDNPNGVYVDGAGNIFINDANNNVIRKVDAGGIITTFAGDGTPGYSGDGGPATSAQLHDPEYGIVEDTLGNVFIADGGNNVVREVNASGTISTVAGNAAAGYTGDGGPAISAELNFPAFLSMGNRGSLYVTDIYNSAIRKVQFTSLDFGFVNVGQSSSLSVGVQNTGTGAVTFGSFAAGGDFSVQNTGTCSTGPSLAAGSLCTVDVLFTPSAAGAATGTLTLTDDASNTPQTLPLAGTGSTSGSFTTAPQAITPGAMMTFTDGSIISQTVLIPTGSSLGGAAYMAANFQQWAPTVFNAKRLPATSTNLWSGGTPVASGTTCTSITGAGDNCMVIEDLCFDSSHNPIFPCNIIAASGTEIAFGTAYVTLSAQTNPALIMATDGQNDWANVTTVFVPSYVYAEGLGVNTDTAVVNLPSYNVCLLYDPNTAVKSGATIPLKMYLCDTPGTLDLSGPNLVVHATSLDLAGGTTADEVEDTGNSNPDSDFRFDSTLGPSGGYIFNLQTKGLTPGTYNLHFTAGADTAIHYLVFQVK